LDGSLADEDAGTELPISIALIPNPAVGAE
jgi:hypothetical protein